MPASEPEDEPSDQHRIEGASAAAAEGEVMPTVDSVDAGSVSPVQGVSTSVAEAGRKSPPGTLPKAVSPSSGGTQSSNSQQSDVVVLFPEIVGNSVPVVSAASVPTVDVIYVGDDGPGNSGVANSVAASSSPPGDAVDVVVAKNSKKVENVPEPLSRDANKRMKETLVSAWQDQNGSHALKARVERAMAYATASCGPKSASPVFIDSASGAAAPAASRLPVTRPLGEVRKTPGVPTARVIGQIFNIRSHRPPRASTTSTPGHHVSVASPSAHQALTTATQPATAAPVTAVSPAVEAAPAVQVPVQHNPAPSQDTQSGASARGRGSVSGRPLVRRPRRPARRFAVLRPQDLYEISSQIVSEVMQRNGQPATSAEIITCVDDDDDDAMVVEMSESHSDSAASDVVVIDEPAAAARQSSTGSSTAGPLSGKRLLIPPVSTSRSRRPVHMVEISAATSAADDSDDVVCCDDADAGSQSGVRSGAKNPVWVASSAAAGDEDVLMLSDTPAPSSSTRDPDVVDPHSTAAAAVGSEAQRDRSTHAAGSSAPRPHQDVRSDDAVVLVDSDNQSLSSSGDASQGLRRSDSVIILD